MQNNSHIAIEEDIINHHEQQKGVVPKGGLNVRTDLRAGMAWNDLDDQAQSLWNSLTSAVSNLTGGTDAS